MDGHFLEPRTVKKIGAETKKLLFATSNMQLAACYAIPNGFKHLSVTCPLTGTVSLIIQSQTKALATALQATIYHLPQQSFQRFLGTPNQYVSEHPVHCDDMSAVKDIGGFDDMMQIGVRLFAPVFSNEDEEASFIHDAFAGVCDQKALALIEHLTQDGHLENLNNKLSPCLASSAQTKQPKVSGKIYTPNR